MHLPGLKSFLLAGLLSMAGTGIAIAQPAPAPAPQPVAAAPAAPVAEAPKPADPTLNADGTQKVAPVEHVGQPTDGWIELQDQFSPNGNEAHGFHNWILVPMMLIISVFVLILLGWVVFRYRRSANPVPSKTSHNTLIEVVWTLLPVAILVGIAVPSIRLLAHQYEPAPANAITLKAIGNRWYWDYEYPDNGDLKLTANILKECSEVAKGDRCRTPVDGPRLLATDNRVVLPVGVPIRLLTTANDVIHSWAMPAFWTKLDAVPGRLNETTFTIEKPGVYFGQCSELCGAYHGFMPIAVEAVSPAEFDVWVHSKGGQTKAEGEASAAAAAAASATPENANAGADNAAGTVPTGSADLVNATSESPVTNQAATGTNDAAVGAQ